MISKLKGTGVALVTPFNADKSVDYVSLEKLVDSVSAHVDFLVVFGTTAETPTMTVEEKQEVSKFIIKQNAGKLPIILGVGGNNTSEIVNKLQGLDSKGVDVILSVTPYYNKPSQQGLYEHFTEIAKVSPAPVMLYNVPGRTGVNMNADTCLKLSENKNIIGTKEASGNLGQIGYILKDKPKDFLVFSGDDNLVLPEMALGIDGVISVAANALPKQFAKMLNLTMEGNFKDATKIHLSLLKFIDLIFAEGNPTGIKSALSIQNIIKNELRLPLVPSSKDLENALKKELEQIK